MMLLLLMLKMMLQPRRWLLRAVLIPRLLRPLMPTLMLRALVLLD